MRGLALNSLLDQTLSQGPSALGKALAAVIVTIFLVRGIRTLSRCGRLGSRAGGFLRDPHPDARFE